MRIGRLTPIAILLPLLGACGGGWQVNELPSPQYSPTPEREIRTELSVSEADLGPEALPVAVALNRKDRPAGDENALHALIPIASRRGAMIVVRAAPARGQGLVAMRLTSPAATARVDSITRGLVASAATVGPESAGGPVYVKGYRRKNGTYVAPHTRRRPRRSP